MTDNGLIPGSVRSTFHIQFGCQTFSTFSTLEKEQYFQCIWNNLNTFSNKYPHVDKILLPTVYQPPTGYFRIFMFVKQLQYTHVFIYIIYHVCMPTYVYSVYVCVCVQVLYNFVYCSVAVVMVVVILFIIY